jgi:prevent-host-death family protein
MHETGKPVILTVNGRAEAVVQDAEAYQQLLDRLEQAETIAALRVALAEDARGEAVPAVEALRSLGRKHGISD